MKKTFLFFTIFGIIMNCANAQTIRYVKPGGTGNGNSWANASASIQNMIDYSNVGDQIWIAGGNYPLAATIEMKNGVNVYGGFFGDETNINDRPKSDLDGNGTIEAWEFTYATVLNGQNARRVLNQAANFTTETVWDGLTITGGRTSSGVGAYLRQNCYLINSIIRDNNSTSGVSATYYGGGIYNDGGTISYCKITENALYSGQQSAWGGRYL